MFLKLALISVLLLLLKDTSGERTVERHPPLEKESIIDTKPKQDNRHYRSVQQAPAPVEEEYKLEPDLDNDIPPFDQEKILVGDPQILLQRKRWKRTNAKIRALREVHDLYEGRKACFGNRLCKPSYIPYK